MRQEQSLYENGEKLTTMKIFERWVLFCDFERFAETNWGTGAADLISFGNGDDLQTRKRIS